jgi:hypothetical protein
METMGLNSEMPCGVEEEENCFSGIKWAVFQGVKVLFSVLDDVLPRTKRLRRLCRAG